MIVTPKSKIEQTKENKNIRDLTKRTISNTIIEKAKTKKQKRPVNLLHNEKATACISGRFSKEQNALIKEMILTGPFRSMSDLIRFAIIECNIRHTEFLDAEKELNYFSALESFAFNPNEYSRITNISIKIHPSFRIYIQNLKTEYINSDDKVVRYAVSFFLNILDNIIRVPSKF